LAELANAREGPGYNRGLSTAIHKCGYVSNGRKKSFDRITGFTGFFPKTQEKSC
jgi:hypothetical protein